MHSCKISNAEAMIYVLIRTGVSRCARESLLKSSSSNLSVNKEIKNSILIRLSLGISVLFNIAEKSGFERK